MLNCGARTLNMGLQQRKVHSCHGSIRGHELVRAEVGLALVRQNPCGLDGRAVVRHGPPHSLIKRISAELTAPFGALKI